MERSSPTEVKPTLRPPARILVIATDELAGPELLEEFRDRLRDVEAEVMVIAPAVEKTVFHHALGDVDAAVMEAGRRLETSLDELRRVGVPALGEIGDSDPILAGIEESGPGLEPARSGDELGPAANLPRPTQRILAAIVAAVIVVLLVAIGLIALLH